MYQHILAACIALVPVMGQACVISLPSCENAARDSQVYLYNEQGSDTLIIHEANRAGVGFEERLAIVSCPSRKALVVRESGYAGDGFGDTVRILQAAHQAELVMTLRDIRKHVRRAGGTGRLVTLPKNHCVCGLEIQAPVNNRCPHQEGLG